MHLSPTDIRDLLTERYPRHIRDAQVVQLTSSVAPDDAVLLIVEEDLWSADLDLGRSAHSMTLDTARRIHDELGQVIANAEQV